MEGYEMGGKRRGENCPEDTRKGKGKIYNVCYAMRSDERGGRRFRSVFCL